MCIRDSLLGLQILAADKPNTVSSRVAVRRHVNATQRVCDGLGQNKIVRVVGKNFGPVLSHLWTKVHEIFAFARLSMSRFVQQIFAIKYQSCLTTEQM